MDGENQEVTNPFSVGDMSIGDSHVVTWGVRFGTWGLRTYSIEALSTDLGVESVTVSGKKMVHKPGTLDSTIALVTLGDAEGDAVVSEIESFGWQAANVTPTQVAAGNLSAAEYPVAVVYCTSSSLPSSLSALGFTEAIKGYMESGGNLVLLGTAAEILDTSGITVNMFSTRGYPGYVRIEDTTHPVSEGWSLDQQINLNNDYLSYSYATTSTIDPTLGVAIIGHDTSTSRKTFGEVPYCSGKAMFIPGRLGGDSPQDGLRTLFLRSADYLLTRDYGALQVGIDSGGIGIQDESAEITAEISAVAGFSVSGVAVTLTKPADVTIVGLVVNGNQTTPVTDIVSLGDMTNGESHTIVWQVECPSDWGINRFNFNVSAESTDPRVEIAHDSPTKTVFIHKEGCLSYPLVVIDLNDAEGDAVVSEIEFSGWQAVTLSPDQVAAGSLSAAEHPVAIVYCTSKVISEALGHSSVAFTMDVYSHIIEGMQSDAMALLDEVLPVGKNGIHQRINAKLTPTLSIMSSPN